MENKKILLTLILSSLITPLATSSAMMNNMNFNMNNNINMMNNIQNSYMLDKYLLKAFSKLNIAESIIGETSYNNNNNTNRIINAAYELTKCYGAWAHKDVFSFAGFWTRQLFHTENQDYQSIKPECQIFQPLFAYLMKNYNISLFKALIRYEQYILILRFYGNLLEHSKIKENIEFITLYNHLKVSNITPSQACDIQFMINHFIQDVHNVNNLNPMERKFMQKMYNHIFNEQRMEPLREEIQMIEKNYYHPNNMNVMNNNFNNFNMNMNNMNNNFNMNNMNNINNNFNMNMNNMNKANGMNINNNNFNMNMNNMNNMNMLNMNMINNNLNNIDIMNMMNMINMMGFKDNNYTKMEIFDLLEALKKEMKDIEKIGRAKFSKYYERISVLLDEELQRYEMNEIMKNKIKSIIRALQKTNIVVETLAYKENLPHEKYLLTQKYGKNYRKDFARWFKKCFAFIYLLIKTRDERFFEILTNLLSNNFTDIKDIDDIEKRLIYIMIIKDYKVDNALIADIMNFINEEINKTL